MYRFSFGVAFLLFSLSAKAEHLNGHILVNEKKILFELDYKIGTDNKLSGFSLTAKGTKDETKCRIKGHYHPKTGNLFFYETVVLKSKATYKNLNFCLLTATIKKSTGKNTINYKGRVTGYIRGKKKVCATGIIFLNRKKVIAPKTITQAKKTIVAPVKGDTLLSTAKSKQQISYTYNAENAYLEIWDDAKLDGDRVSIILDNKVVLANYKLTKSKKRVKLNLSGKSYHLLKFKAINEGQSAPNTSSIYLNLGDQTKKLTAHIRKQEAVYIELRKN